MEHTRYYEPRYAASRALVIGINQYSSATRLQFARNDAEVVAEMLQTKLNFPLETVAVLLDADASRNAIMSAFMKLTKSDVGENDRVIIFFAGHGHTHPSRRGDVGFLVPADGEIDDLATLIRWDELTKSAEMVPAKHMLFVMDACFGGLAFPRQISPGSSRFMKDMLTRYSRQVLSSGKADEVVADGNGTRPGHSIFTGHFLDAIDGHATSSEGILTAAGVMAYVYEHVSKDAFSNQTPHFGHHAGDGDMILIAPEEREPENDGHAQKDVLVEVPSIAQLPAVVLSQPQTFAEQVKECLSDPRLRIQLDDLVTSQLKAFQYAMRDEEFPLSDTDVSAASLTERLRKYELSSTNILTLGILLGRWATAEQRPLLTRIASRMADSIDERGGVNVWLGLRWYPLLLLLYGSGIAALSAENYEALMATFLSPTVSQSQRDGLNTALIQAISSVDEIDLRVFRLLPGYERNYLPVNEYVLTAIQARIDDLLFLGKSYESLFNRFEVFSSLQFTEITSKSGGMWSRLGRFAWMHRSRRIQHGPFVQVIEEAKSHGPNWRPLKAGFCGGRIERFNELVQYYQTVIAQQPWH